MIFREKTDILLTKVNSTVRSRMLQKNSQMTDEERLFFQRLLQKKRLFKRKQRTALQKKGLEFSYVTLSGALILSKKLRSFTNELAIFEYLQP